MNVHHLEMSAMNWPLAVCTRVQQPRCPRGGKLSYLQVFFLKTELSPGGGHCSARSTTIARGTTGLTTQGTTGMRSVMTSESKSKSKYDICELYSRPRMCIQAQTHKLKGGWSIDKDFHDPVTGRVYDLRNRKDQNEVRKMIKRDQPLVLTVSPPCTLFSIANQGPIAPKELEEAKELMRFAVAMCDLQSLRV